MIFVTRNLNATHAKWLEYALMQQAQEADRSMLENGNAPQEPTISEAERAEMQVFLEEIYQTLPLAGLRAFELPRTVTTDKPNEHVRTGSDTKDTIVVPAHKDGFDRVFIAENAWYAIRISGGMLDKIKYIASYQTAPISAVTHGAQVDHIEPYGEEGKYKLIFSEPAKELEEPVPIGNATRGMMQGSRYTSFDKLSTAKEITELFE